MPIVIIKRVFAMIARTRRSLAAALTPMAGLALGIASLGWCWENAGQFDGRLQLLGAAIAAVLLLVLTFKFPDPPAPAVAGSRPSRGGQRGAHLRHGDHGGLQGGRPARPDPGAGLWLFAVIIHLVFLATFVWHRARAFEIHHMVPSWFCAAGGDHRG